jgi:hypothetical protein
MAIAVGALFLGVPTVPCEAVRPGSLVELQAVGFDMSLLQAIQNAAASADTDVATLLRKCKILAARLGSQEFSAWVDMELNGYPAEQPVPTYRRLVTGWWARFFGDWNVERTAIPDSIVPEAYREKLRWTEIREGVAGIQDFASANSYARIEHPELIPSVQGKLYPSLGCINVWAEISSNDFAQLISAIKNRVLDFAIALETENPDAGEGPVNSKPISEDRLFPIVNNYFGQVGNVAQGSHSFHQTANLGIQPGDLEAVKKFLLAENVSPHDVQELEDAVRADKGRFGPRVQAWLGKMAVVSVEIGKGVAIQSITAAIKAHYGIH